MFFLILLRQEFELFFKKCFIRMGFACIYLCMSVYYVCAAWWPRMLEELVGNPGTEGTGSSELPGRFQESNLGLPEERQVILTTKLSFQLHNLNF